ncbi:MAG: membrane protein of unknown function [Promethearchaeota archaeon]|nr:MAG: membrane protein of unknown function [Candidatus Lokiarchaeota archaeon]
MIGRPGMFPDISPYNEFWFPPNISFNIDFIGIIFAIVSLYLGIKLVRFKGENRNRSFSDQTKPLLILAEVTLILCLMWIVSFSFIIKDGTCGTLGRGTNTVISGPILFFRWIFYYPGFGVIGAFLSLLLIMIARRSSKLDLKSSQ